MSNAQTKRRKPKERSPLPEITPEEAEAIEQDWEDELFGEDADYMRAAGLADKVGNK